MLDADTLADTVGAIYEAAVLPGSWPATLTRLSRIAGCQGGAILTSNEAGTGWMACDVVRPHLEQFAAEGWLGRNSRMEALLADRTAGFVTDLDIFTAEQIADLPIYRDFYHPRGYGWGAATCVRSPSGDVIVVSLERMLAHGPVTAPEIAMLDVLRPHLARAALLASQLHMQRMEGSLQALDAIGIPAALVGAEGRLQATNTAFKALSASFTTRAGDRLALLEPSAQALLQRGLAAVSKDTGSQVRSIPVPAREEASPFVLHIVPVRRQAHDLFARSQALLVAAAPNARRIDATLLSGLYDLTPAEAAIAGHILSGMRPAAIAARQGTSIETVRTHIKRILLKTGCPTQTEFVRRLTPAMAALG